VVQKCNALLNIPANPDYSSLNLSQAVQVLAYECRMTELEVQGGPMQTSGDARAPGEVGFHGQSASVAEIEGMFAHLEQALVAIDFLNPDNPKKLMPRLKRMFARPAGDRRGQHPARHRPPDPGAEAGQGRPARTKRTRRRLTWPS
jgi:tRNA/rRNA methyltransferase